jgi:hypothetical protein
VELAHDIAHLRIGTLIDMVADGRLVATGRPGGPEWTRTAQARLFESLEAGWPTGQLLAWVPYPTSRWYLLDGHRRLTTLLHAADRGTTLVRDLAVAAPSYLPAPAHGGHYLPVSKMLTTWVFLAATRHLPRRAGEHAGRAAHRLGSAGVQMIRLLGGTPTLVATLAGRLVPGRVEAASLHRIAAATTTSGAAPGFIADLQVGQRVVLEYTDDPHTVLTGGAAGTITRVDPRLGCVEVAWDNGSRLSMWPAAGDRFRPEPTTTTPGT